MTPTLAFLASAMVAAATPFSDWLEERDLCQTTSLGTPTKWSFLCDNAQFFDEIGLDPRAIMRWACLPWKGEYLEMCTEEDKNVSHDGIEEFVRKQLCGSSVECSIKWSGPALAQSQANCNVLGVCTPVQEALTNQVAAESSKVMSSSIAEAINAAASGARETARQAAQAAGRSAASVGQAGRRAAERAAKEAAQQLGAGVTRVTSNGVEVAMQEGATGAATGWLQTTVSFIGPAVGGAFNAGFEAYNNGASSKVGAKFASGVAGNVAGATVGAACGPFMWLCAPAASIMATQVLDYLVVETAYADTTMTEEEDEKIGHAFAQAMEKQKATAPKLALLFVLAARNEYPSPKDLSYAQNLYTRSALRMQLDGTQLPG